MRQDTMIERPGVVLHSFGITKWLISDSYHLYMEVPVKLSGWCVHIDYQELLVVRILDVSKYTSSLTVFFMNHDTSG